MVSEKDLQSYLKVAASALPCREARKEFSSYVHLRPYTFQYRALLDKSAGSRLALFLAVACLHSFQPVPCLYQLFLIFGHAFSFLV